MKNLICFCLIVGLTCTATTGCSKKDGATDGKSEAKAKKKGDPKKQPQAKGDAGAIPKGWEKFVSDKGKFSVAFPGKPQASTEKDPVDGAVTYIFTFAPEDSQASYEVSYNDLPKEALANGADFLLESSLAQFKESTKKKTKIKIGEHPGVEAEIEIDQDGQKVALRMRIIVVGVRMYNLTVGSTPALIGEANADGFFNSLALK